LNYAGECTRRRETKHQRGLGFTGTKKTNQEQKLQTGDYALYTSGNKTRRKHAENLVTTSGDKNQ
jgi:hypothetical protein